MEGKDWAALGTGIGQIGVGIGNMALGWKQGKKNYKLQKKMFEYQKGVQQTTWQREDNAVQRRVADLRAAGLSPVLAAGQGASAGQVVATTTPQREYPQMSENALNMLALVKMKKDIDISDMQRGLIALQKDTERHKAENLGSGVMKNLADAFKAYQEGLLSQHDYGIMAGKPVLYKNASEFGKIGRDFTSPIIDVIKAIKKFGWPGDTRTQDQIEADVIRRRKERNKNRKTGVPPRA